MTDSAAWTRKTRELHTRIFDSTVLNEFTFRVDDIIIATYPKAGTTWMQQIESQLVFDGDPDRALTTSPDARTTGPGKVCGPSATSA